MTSVGASTRECQRSLTVLGRRLRTRKDRVVTCPSQQVLPTVRTY
jgi:hypothetical protein